MLLKGHPSHWDWKQNLDVIISVFIWAVYKHCCGLRRREPPSGQLRTLQPYNATFETVGLICIYCSALQDRRASGGKHMASEAFPSVSIQVFFIGQILVPLQAYLFIIKTITFTLP